MSCKINIIEKKSISVQYFIQKPVTFFAVQIKWLTSNGMQHLTEMGTVVSLV